MQALLEVVLPVFLVIGVGYFATWRGILGETTIDGLMRYATRLAIPSLLFQAIAKLDLSVAVSPALLGTYYSVVLGMFALGMFGARYLFSRPWPDCVAIGFACLFMNSVLLGLPIAERAFGPDRMAPSYAIVAFHAPFCYGVGVTVMEVVRASGRGFIATMRNVLAAMFRNALVIGIVLGFVFNLGGFSLPNVAWDGLGLIVRSGLPVALIAMGGVLYRYRPEGDLMTVGFICLITLFVQPALTWTAGQATGLDDQAFKAAVLTAAMAPGINAYIFADMYGVARRVAATAVLATTALSVFTIWGWLALLG